MTTPTPVELCSNCLRPITNHRPWCGEVQTVPPPKEGDIVEHPLLGRVPLLSVYSRQQAIEDGTLVDCTQEMFDRLNREAGLKFDVAMTAAVFDRYVAISGGLKAVQDLSGRYWDLVWMFRNAASKASDQDELFFEFHCIPNGEATRATRSAD